MMQAYAEGYELLCADSPVTDVPAVFDAWRQGTVIRSWLLDLCSTGPVGRTRSGVDPRLGRRLGRGTVDGRGSHRPRGSHASDLGRPVRAILVPPGRFPGHEAHRRHAQPVRRTCRPQLVRRCPGVQTRLLGSGGEARLSSQEEPPQSCTHPSSARSAAPRGVGGAVALPRVLPTTKPRRWQCPMLRGARD